MKQLIIYDTVDAYNYYDQRSEDIYKKHIENGFRLYKKLVEAKERESK